MNSNELSKGIVSQFDKCANEFCRKTNGYACEIYSDFTGEETAENLKFRYADIYYNSKIIRFKYTAKTLGTYSILECLVLFDKTDDAVAIPLPFIVDICDLNILKPLCIPMISNKKCMAEAFLSLGNTVVGMMEKISEIADREEWKTELVSYFFAELSRIMKFEKTEITAFDYKVLSSRFAYNTFLLPVKNGTKKASGKLRRLKELFSYEERMITLWESEKEIDVSEIPSVVGNMKYVDKRGISKSDFREFAAFFVSWILLMIPISAVYFGLFYLMYYAVSHDSVYVFGFMRMIPYSILAGFITSVSVSYFTIPWFYRLLFKKRFSEFREMSNMTNTGKDKSLMKWLSRIIVLCCIVMLFFVVNENINFKSDGFYDNSKFFSLKGDYYTYDEIDRVKYIPDRVNGLGDTIDFPSYALIMKDGKTIDLYEVDDIENYEDFLLDFMKEQGVVIEK